MKRILTILLFGLLTTFAFAQTDDDLFGGDDFFGDDGIEEVTDVSAKSDLSKGVIFNTGSIKVGGSVSAGITTSTVLYSPDNDDLKDNIYNTKLSPDLSATLTVDARPTETLRLYTKFGFAYPFENSVNSLSFSTLNTDPVTRMYFPIKTTTISSINEWFKLKELFTDFSYKDTAFFRFGIHTVTWGAGYFFSPVSDMINTSSIDPENPEAQVDGALNLRTQIIIPNSQNCLWFYVIPSTDEKAQTASSYARDTAFAGKADILLGNWELGLGAFYKYQNAPKAMLTATGSLKKVSFFGEFVYSYGAASEWEENTDWDDKTSIFQATAGLSYYWKEPKINLAAQYYWESNDVDFTQRISQYGHNVAVMVSKGSLFNNSDLSLAFFAMGNIGHKEATSKDIENMIAKNPMLAMELNSSEKIAAAAKNASAMPALTANLMLRYTPFTDVTVGAGPVVTFKDFETNPNVSLKLTATLGGGKF